VSTEVAAAGREGVVQPLVSPEWLAAHLDDPELRLIDSRYYLDGSDPEREYESAHIPGAIYADTERDLTGHPGFGGGRHPMPERAEFECTARRLGISATSHVVVYSNLFSAARLWWLLRFYAFARVSLLDGGLGAWGGPLIGGPSPSVPPGDFVAAEGRRELLASLNDVAARDRSIVLLDARGPDRFRGEVAPGDPYPGRIPGAVSAWWQEVSAGVGGRFASPEQIHDRLAERGLGSSGSAICYCGSGVQACHLVFSASLAGFEEPRLYIGSWSEWARTFPSPHDVGPGVPGAGRDAGSQGN
jgi:thiosulfate/3-mercaptopyruvate sulfurtransferase